MCHSWESVHIDRKWRVNRVRTDWGGRGLSLRALPLCTHVGACCSVDPDAAFRRAQHLRPGRLERRVGAGERAAQVAEFGLTCKTMNDGRIFATAPEMLTGRARNLTAAQDVYSFGTLLYEVFMRVPPTESMDPHEWLANLEVSYRGARHGGQRCVKPLTCVFAFGRT